ncbi:RING finger domain protein [Aspergillus heteromorphus CBS 117.55]|uniref:RING finger domain protein n=1 Tax=Aspergillus heteromorphus CBS 117.55 TaxID=1448321 RepID=A0A317WCW7_9EURO|nr:RING finger domain protein [Aspergillus heteromorphus CBS 117.55]PWY82878.1 RING finger domain protein [Aspergillus heteromorphus CBS 117.55]
MTAKSVTTIATLFADPTNTTAASNDSTAFALKLDDGTVQTLSKQNAPDKGPIEGILFVPSLSAQSPCNSATAPFVPANVTRIESATPFGDRVIGLAPWVNAECAQEFLNASQQVRTDALLFFLPSNDDTKPPSANDPTWRLGGSDGWQARNEYPVYAIPGAAGVTLMDRLSRDGNLGNPNDQMNQKSGSKKMASIWGFILAIIGTILVLTIILLLFYQLVHKRQRRELQRRIEAGEADLEHMGMHQIRVPHEFLNSIPIYIYTGLGASHSEGRKDDPAKSREHLAEITEESEEEAAESPKSPAVEVRETADAQDKEPADGGSVRRSSQSTMAGLDEAAYPRHKNRLSRSQTMCAICLDDFVPGSSTVRELPCGHIFHPSCIDTSLTQSSSLCPLCKKSVLPTGWMPYQMADTLVSRDMPEPGSPSPSR